MSLIKKFLQGNWLGHPLHPALVHVPTGLFPAALLFDLFVLADRDVHVAQRCAIWCIAVGLIGAIAAAPAGVADWLEIKRGKPAYKLGLIHLAMNVAVLALMAISLYLRLRSPGDVPGDKDPGSAGYAMALGAIANVVLFISGYLGGRMVFDEGVSVARLSKKKWEKLARAGHARLPVE